MTSQVVPMPNPPTGGMATVPARRTGAPSSILGMYVFAGATFVVAAQMAHWYGNAQTAIVIFPLVLFFGVAQFYAGAWAFRTDDGLGAAMHGTWGAFWTAFGILDLLHAMGNASHPAGVFPAMGFWFITIAAITWGITAASPENKGVTGLLVLLAIGATLEAIAELVGFEWLRMLAGYFLIASAIAAWCIATLQLVRLGKIQKPQATAPVAQSQPARAAS